VRDDGGMLLDEDGDPLALVFNTKGWAGAHYATFPPPMIEPLIKSSASERGVCPRCGAAWERVVERKKHPTRDMEAQRKKAALQSGRNDGHVPGPGGMVDALETTGWRPTCDCSGLTIIGDQPQKPSKHLRDIVSGSKD